LGEVLNRIIDDKNESATLPEKDERIIFSSGKLEKRSAVLGWLKEKIIISVPEGSEFTNNQINDMFNNIKQEQMATLVQQIVDSGLLIQTLTHKEKWEKAIADSKKS
jgi:hypothetical protein